MNFFILTSMSWGVSCKIVWFSLFQIIIYANILLEIKNTKVLVSPDIFAEFPTERNSCNCLGYTSNIFRFNEKLSILSRKMILPLKAVPIFLLLIHNNNVFGLREYSKQVSNLSKRVSSRGHLPLLINWALWTPFRLYKSTFVVGSN